MPGVLIVDDDHAIRALLESLFQDEGWQIGSAEDGIRALEYLDRRLPDLILLDLKMPKMDGQELLAALRERDIRTPVLVMSAQHNRGTVPIGDRSVGFVAKPFDLDQLLAMANAAVERSTPG